jgi:hypothetical protein
MLTNCVALMQSPCVMLAAKLHVFFALHALLCFTSDDAAATRCYAACAPGEAVDDVDLALHRGWSRRTRTM